MRTTTVAVLTLTAALALGACGEDGPTSPLGTPASELAKGGSGKGKGGKATDRILFTHEDAQGFLDIHTMNPDGSDLTRVLPVSGFSNWDARWTPDHSRIVFLSNRSGSAKVFIMNANGTKPLQLTQGSCNDRNPAPSPDGTRIAFQRPCVGGGIFVINADGSGLTQVTTNWGDKNPTWTPGGTHVVFANNTEATTGIYRIKPDGTDRSTVWTCGVTACQAPMLSPDGTRLAFWSPVNDGQITILTFSNNSWLELAHLGLQSYYAPTFSPDGTKLVFTAGPYGMDYELWSVNAADGSGLTRLTTMAGADMGPSWHR
jgi:Tol biopolymer transport system component